MKACCKSGAFGWLIPGGLLVLMPKCPVCLAGYIAVGTGIGLSVPAASHLRLLLIVLCAGTLAFLTIKWLLQSAHWKS